MKTIDTTEDLIDLYGEPLERSLWKEIEYINDHYKAFIERSPFLILATASEHGIDCSPRGDPAGFVRVVDEKHLQMPDRRGNNRLDSLKNIVLNPNVGIIFLIPNVGETIRVSGKARIVVDPELCETFSVQGKPASSVLSITVEKAYFQCQKALVRSKLWDSTTHVDRTILPTAGEMAKVFAASKDIEFDAREYDKHYPEHMKKTLY